MVDPFPVSERLLCYFAAYMADEGLSPQSGKSYMAAIRNMQISVGLPDPREQSSLPVLKRVQAGISRSALGRGPPSKIRLPITAQLLNQLRDALDGSSHPEKVLLWAVGCTAFFGFFRLGELLLDSATSFNPATHLAWGDIMVDNEANPQIVQVHIKQSKTDQFGKGAKVVLGKTGQALCPVAAILGYIAIRGSRPGPFFINARGKPLIKSTFVAAVREILTSLGFPQHLYAGHSFRIGAATTAALSGVEDSTIQLLG